MDRQNLSGQNIYFLLGKGQRLQVFPYIHKNKTHRVARLTHDRKFADSAPPPSNEPRAIAPALCQNRSQDDPNPTPPPLSQVTFTQQFKSVYHTLSTPPPVITYHTHLCCFVFATTFFFILLFTFLKKNCAPFSSPSYATEFVYPPVYPPISKHTYLPEGYRMMVYF